MSKSRLRKGPAASGRGHVGGAWVWRDGCGRGLGLRRCPRRRGWSGGACWRRARAQKVEVGVWMR